MNMDYFLVLQTTAEIPTYERTVRKNFAYHPIMEHGMILAYRLKQRFHPHHWHAVYMITDFELLKEIKNVYEYLQLKYS